jgi:hypothetical protein
VPETAISTGASETAGRLSLDATTVSPASRRAEVQELGATKSGGGPAAASPSSGAEGSFRKRAISTLSVSWFFGTLRSSLYSLMIMTSCAIQSSKQWGQVCASISAAFGPGRGERAKPSTSRSQREQ